VGQALPFARPRAGPGGLIMPVAGFPAGALRDSWGAARGDGTRAHHGTDLMAAGGTPVVAAAPGTVEKLFQSHDGGTTLYVRSPDGRWSFYYAHLAGYAPRIREGMRVRAGDPLGYVGDTGNAGGGNTHLHFGVSRMAPGERWWQGEPVDPYPLLAGSGARR
ncbi:MAG: M23 family metallopeptidase, partial [Methylobacterium sp.]